MTTLHDQLADLADTAPRALPEPDLWGRGRRYGRRRRIAGATLALAGAVAVASGLLAWSPSGGTSIEPAGGGTGLRLPDRLYHPDPWAPGISENGPIGRLVAVVGAPRDSWSNLDLTEFADVAGVNASGEYVFLDLGDRVGDDLELSADGRYLAYWYADAPDGGAGAGEDAVADGIAVLDAETGETRRHAVETPLGLAPEERSWVEDRLWVPVWPYDELTATSASSRLDTMLAWDQSDAKPEVVDAPGLGSVGGLAVAGDDLVDLRRHRVVLIGPDGTQRVVGRIEGTVDSEIHLDPTGTRVVALRQPAGSDRDGQPASADQLVVGTLGARPEAGVRLVPVTDVDVDRVVGWRSDHEVVTYRWTGDGARYESVDVTTGEVDILVRVPTETWVPGDRIAADALAAPTFAAPAPPDLRDPRMVALAGTGGALVLALGGLVLWRRRVRP